MKTYFAKIFSRYEQGYDTWEISRGLGIPRDLVLKVLKGEIKCEYELQKELNPKDWA